MSKYIITVISIIILNIILFMAIHINPKIISYKTYDQGFDRGFALGYVSGYNNAKMDTK